MTEERKLRLWAVVKPDGTRYKRTYNTERAAWIVVCRVGVLYLTNLDYADKILAAHIERRKSNGYSVIPVAWHS